ncbi:MAG: hypothetical protein KJZ91_12190 [Myxococcales bacterium]|nr:hypothetical protein [Myxococcales bacterium]
MIRGYPYDAGAFARVWRRLWELVPAYHRVLDGGDRLDLEEATRRMVAGTLTRDHDLARVLGALAAPLAAVRQSVEELHRDLFIDSCGDAAIPLLADMVGTTLVFPDATSNRRDVRGTVSWRRRKGTPPMLEELVEELSARMTPLGEGWQRLAMAQDLDLPRLERTTIDLRDLRVAELTHGPLDASAHVVDLRRPSTSTGRYHPHHLSHWLHVTELFPAYHAEAAYVGDRGDPRTGVEHPPTTPPALARDGDWRFAVHPLGRYQALRARRVGAADPLRTDRIPAMHFAHAPGDYHGRDGRFTIELLGLPAAVAAVERDAEPVRAIADRAILIGDHRFEALARPRRAGDDTVIELIAVVPVAGPEGPVASGAATVVASAPVTAVGLGATTQGAVAPPGTIAMLRLRPAAGATAFFPGGTFALGAGRGGGDAGRWLPPVTTSLADTAELRRRGQPRGAVAFEVPPTWVMSERWFYLGADGTLGEAQHAGAGPVVVALGPDDRIERARVARPGVGGAWPPLPYTAERVGTSELVPAPGCGPARLHGGPVLDATGGPLIEAPEVDARLVFAIATTAVTTTFRPIGALTVGAPAPGDRGRWQLLDDTAAPVTTAAAGLGRLRELAEGVADAQPGAQRLVVRFEAAAAGAVLPPGAVAWRGATWRGASDQALLVHLPALTAGGAAPAGWPAPAGWHVSPAVSVGRDGSTWDGEVVARAAAGQVAPIGPADTGDVLLRRRQLRWRNLCSWQREVADHRKLDPTPPGFLDVDVEHGLFALAGAEPPPRAPAAPPPDAGARAPSVTVEYQQGASAHVGALPADRSTALGHLPEPATRIVSRHGVAGGDELVDALAIPRYRTLTDALAAITADGGRAEQEVIEIADSATYHDEAPAWPGTVGGGAPTRRLVIRAADGARPVVVLAGWTTDVGAGLTQVVLRGLTLASLAPLTVAPPLVDPPPAATPARAAVRIELSTVASEHLAFAVTAPPAGVELVVHRAITGPLTMHGAGALSVTGSIVDPGDRAASAITASDGVVDVDRATVLGVVAAGVLEASESIFLAPVTVADRFRGCIRFSRVEVGSVLPRRHRVVPDLDAAPVEPVPVRLVSVDRHDPAYARLAETCDPRVRFGAADGGEQGAFHDELWPVRREAVLRRLSEYTPAGMVTGLIRLD